MDRSYKSARIIINKLSKKRNFKEWNSLRSGGTKTLRIKQVKAVLDIVSGRDIASMLNDIILFYKLNLGNSVKYGNALTNLGHLFNDKKQKNFSPPIKRKILKQLRNSGFKHKEACSFGFKCSKGLWKSCVSNHPLEKRGRKSLNSDLVESIQNHLDFNSAAASNRTVVSKDKNLNGKKVDIPVKYRNATLLDLYNSFDFKNELSFACFCSYINKEYKKPYRFTDLCEYCEKGKLLKKQISEIALRLNYVNASNEEFDCDDFQKFLTSRKNETNDFSEELRLSYEFSLIEYHRFISNNQRMQFNRQKKDEEFLKENLLFVIDFKGKIRLGMSPRELSGDYYEENTRLLLGVGIYHFNTTTNKIECINVDIISEESTSAFTVIRKLRFLRSQNFFIVIDKPNYTFWADAGSHFKCNEINHYLFIELANEGKAVTINFHGDQHGKSCRDQHFSVLSRFYKKTAFKKQICSTNDLIDCFVTNQNEMNEHRIKNKLDPVILHVLKFENNATETLPKLSFPIPNIRCYFNLENSLKNSSASAKPKIETTILTGLKNKMLVDLSDFKIKKSDENVLQREENMFNSKQFDIGFLENKINFIKRKLNQKVIEHVQYTPEKNKTPEFCKKSMKPNKKKKFNHCQNNESCSYECNFYVEDIIEANSRIGQKEINIELANHGHPKSRAMDEEDGNGKAKQRSTEEGRAELVEHYKHFHKYAKKK